MEFDHEEANTFMLKVATKAPFKKGILQLLNYCQKHDPDRLLFSKLSKLPFKKDAAGIAAQLRFLAERGMISVESKGFYFGLDGLNMPDGKGIQFGCSPEGDDSAGSEWATECDTFPGNPCSPVLSEIYRRISGASLWDYVLALGYCGLALRLAFESIPSKILLGTQRERFVCWGFHDGDLEYLGKLTETGFSTATIEPPEAPAVLRAIHRKLPKAKGALKWIQRAEQTCLEKITKPVLRLDCLMEVADLYSECGDWKAVLRVLKDAKSILDSGVNTDDSNGYGFHKDYIIRHYWDAHDAGKTPIDIRWFFGDEVDEYDKRLKYSERELNLLTALRALLENPNIKTLKKGVIPIHRDLAKLKRQFGDLARYSELNQLLLKAYVVLGDAKRSRLILESDENLEFEYPALCQKYGLYSELKRLAAFKLKQTVRSSHGMLMNVHHLSEGFAKAAELYARAGDMKNYKRVMSQAMKLGNKALNAGVSEWQITVLYSRLAVAAHRASDSEGKEFLSQSAIQWVKYQSKAKGAHDFATTGSLALVDMYKDMDEYEKGLEFLKKVRNKSSILGKMCAFLANARKDSELAKWVSALKSPHKEFEAYTWAARSLMA